MLKKHKQVVSSVMAYLCAVMMVSGGIACMSYSAYGNTHSEVCNDGLRETIVFSDNTPIEKTDVTTKAVSQQVPRKIVANCSAYTASADECGGDSSGITASGKVAVEGRTIAMDDVPLGTIVRINGKEYTVEDRFGGGYTNRIDIYFQNKEDALRFGRQYLEVEILG